MTHIQRRALLTAPVLLPWTAMGQVPWRPGRPVTLVVPFAAGSGTDGVGRIVAPLLAEAIGATVLVENRAGANGTIAAVAVARAPADGHTLFSATNTTHSANPALMRRQDYDPQSDFTPIARLGTPIFLLVVGPTVSARDVAGFIAWARGRDGQLNYASANAIGVVGMATLARLAGFNATNVPYRSAPQALTDLIGGRVDAMMIDITASIGHVRDGRLHALAVTTRDRTRPGSPASTSRPGWASSARPRSPLTWLRRWVPHCRPSSHGRRCRRGSPLSASKPVAPVHRRWARWWRANCRAGQRWCARRGSSPNEKLVQ